MHNTLINPAIFYFSAPAEIIALSSNDTVIVNSTSFITCVGSGVPTPTIRWKKDGVNLVNNSQVCYGGEHIHP